MSRTRQEPPKSASQIELEALKSYHSELATAHYTPQEVAAWVEEAWKKSGVYNNVVSDARRIDIPHAVVWQVHYFSISSVSAVNDNRWALTVYELGGGVLCVGIPHGKEDKYSVPDYELTNKREAVREEVRRRYAEFQQRQK